MKQVTIKEFQRNIYRYFGELPLEIKRNGAVRYRVSEVATTTPPKVATMPKNNEKVATNYLKTEVENAPKIPGKSKVTTKTDSEGDYLENVQVATKPATSTKVATNKLPWGQLSNFKPCPHGYLPALCKYQSCRDL